jgi:hypothetical protein
MRGRNKMPRVIGRHHTDYRQSRKSHNRWDKLKRMKKDNKLLAKLDNGQLPTSPGSILEHTDYDGKSYLQNENYISDFDKEIKRIEGRE